MNVVSYVKHNDITKVLFNVLFQQDEDKALSNETSFNGSSLVEWYLISRTIAVVVEQCCKVTEGEQLKSLYFDWIDLAKAELKSGAELMKAGFGEYSFEQLEYAVCENVNSVEQKFSCLGPEQLAKECELATLLLNSFILLFKK